MMSRREAVSCTQSRDQELREYYRMVQLIRSDRMFNMKELERKSYYTAFVSQDSKQNKPKKNHETVIDYTPLEAPATEPLPVPWTELQLIFNMC